MFHKNHRLNAKKDCLSALICVFINIILQIDVTKTLNYLNVKIFNYLKNRIIFQFLRNKYI